ncbi:filamentous hemagglutinin N-terminal domain-containing protein [Argonema antarcticum]|uniref:two-partner secretion domain-containing protein n=1 Tax=Argonema antarcticum TaxID=2942763 RepID=UPI002013A9D7|nr:S-layer family protein [Argonema antarcticum]MCL1470313.1 S-layer family protein [Argonema antarcticum A004/B2]
MKQLNYSLCFASTLSFLCLTTNHPTIAQIIPDATLPSNSVAIPNGNSISIEGGTTNGSNLFHSFQEFSVPTGTEAFFNNGLDIQNIFSRVTGKNISNIDGLIRANGTANLFLINPNGIIFGQNAQLNIGGSFIGSTANSIRFIDGSEFSTTNPTAPSLLTINVPIGLQFGANPGAIVNTSQAIGPTPTLPPLPIEIPVSNKLGLAVAPGQTLALIGGDIQLLGGNLTAYTGQILLGSVKSPGLVQFEPTAFGVNLNYSNIPTFGNIEMNGAFINTSGLGGGKIDIRGGNVTISSSGIYGLTLGNIDGRDIDINAQKLRAEGGALISTLTVGNGTGGAVNIRATDSVELSGIGFESYQQFLAKLLVSGTIDPFDPQIVLVSSTAGSGNAGNITIDAPRVLIENGVGVGSATLSSGNGGNLTIRARVFDLAGSGINNGTLQGSTGTGGNITFEGERLIVRDGGVIASITRTNAAAGNINITASESVEVLRSPTGTAVQTFIGTNAIGLNGRAGDVTIDTKRLIASEGAGITLSSGAIIGESLFATTGGSGGNLTIRAAESIEVVGISGVLANMGQIPSFLATQTTTSNRAGDIQIYTPVLILRDGGIITAASLGAGDAGNVTIDAGRVEVIGSGNNGRFISKIEASVGSVLTFSNPSATANAGSVNLNANRLIVRDGATVNVQALGTGRAGNINVVGDALVLDNQGSIDGRTASGTGANINLQARDLQLRRNSRIATDAGNTTGGNININTNTLVALENSDITANAQQGSGGRVSITAQGIFGTQFRDELTPSSDITATSELGPQFNGTVEINTPDVDPSSGLVELSANFEELSGSIAQGCPASGGNRFAVVGRGGLPVTPYEALNGWYNTGTLNGERERGRVGEWERGGVGEGGSGGISIFAIAIPHSPIIEATGWQKNANGEVELVANDRGTVSSSGNSMPGCGVQ